MRPLPEPARPPRRLADLAVAVVVAGVAIALLLGVVAAPEAGAATDGGASSRVTRDGRILTWILGGRTASGGGARPTSYWLTLTDAELGFLLQLTAADPTLADEPTMRLLQPYLDEGRGGDVDVQLRVDGGRLTGEVRTVPSAGGTATALVRRMITELPALTPTISPPAGSPVLVGTPVFASFDEAQWATVVDRSLSVGGVTARVRARPVAFRLSSGDPVAAGTWRTCDGPGRPYDPAAPATALAQAAAPGTCAVTYRTLTGVRGRRAVWYGDHTVIWRAEWTTDGVTWRSLGDIPRLTVFTRQVRPAAVALESG